MTLSHNSGGGDCLVHINMIYIYQQRIYSFDPRNHIFILINLV